MSIARNTSGKKTAQNQKTKKKSKVLTRVNLKDKEAALIIDENFDMRLCVPKYKSNENVGSNVVYLAELGFRSNDMKFVKRMIKNMINRI